MGKWYLKFCQSGEICPNLVTFAFICVMKISVDWIQTQVHWSRKQPLCQLCSSLPQKWKKFPPIPSHESIEWE